MGAGLSRRQRNVEHMLPASHRLTASADFSAVMRRGAKAGTPTVVVAVLMVPREDRVPWRCGLVVSKAVGNAVVRHRASRRLRHIMWELMEETTAEIPPQWRAEIVLRALSAAPDADHHRLKADVRSGLTRALKKTRRDHL